MKKIFIKNHEDIRNVFPITFLIFICALLFWKGFIIIAESTYFPALGIIWNLIKSFVVIISVLLFVFLVFSGVIIEKKQINKSVQIKLKSKKKILYSLYNKFLSIKISKKRKYYIFSTIKFFSCILIIFFIFFQTLFFYPVLTLPIMGWRADNNVNELQRIISEIIDENDSDYNKTQNILDWFSKDSENMYNIWGRPLIRGIEPNVRIVFGYDTPLSAIFCVRSNGRNDPLWILTSRCGACEEYALLFREMAHASNLKVRSIHCYEGNHNWDEVYLNGTWVIVDPARNRFNVSTEEYKEEFNNPRYVFAEYSNNDKTIKDVTFRYSNLSYINITTVDETNNIIPHCEIEVFSINSNGENVRTELKFMTNESGIYQLSIGSGDAILESNDRIKGLYNSKKQTFTEGDMGNLTIILQKQTKLKDNFSNFIIILIGILWFFALLLLFSMKHKSYKNNKYYTNKRKRDIMENSFFMKM